MDSLLRMTLPIRVQIDDAEHISRDSRGFEAFGILSSAGKHICRFCGISLAARDPRLSLLGHLVGGRYYRKEGQFLLAQDKLKVSKCNMAPAIASQIAKSELQKLLNPAPKEKKIR